MRTIFIIALIISTAANAKEDCSPAALDLNDSTAEETFFFTGTCHYRNEDYQSAVDQWESLSKLDSINEENEDLKIDVLNNLGYMKFFGFGTIKNQNQAVQYWRQAITLGHYEAEYHLCHAYADNEQSTYNISKAKKHCEKAHLIYKGMDDPDKSILSDIEMWMDRLN